jgi:hypothetical protein
MPAASTKPDIKKAPPRTERPAVDDKAKKANVRPHVAKLIKKVINENAPTWNELAKR